MIKSNNIKQDNVKPSLSDCVKLTKTIKPYWYFSINKGIYEQSQLSETIRYKFRCIGVTNLISLGFTKLDWVYEGNYEVLEDLLNDPSRREEYAEQLREEEKGRQSITDQFADKLIADIISYEPKIEQRGWSNIYWCDDLLNLDVFIKNNITNILKNSFSLRVTKADVALNYGRLEFNGLFTNVLNNVEVLPIQIMLECLEIKDELTGLYTWKIFHFWIDTRLNNDNKSQFSRYEDIDLDIYELDKSREEALGKIDRDHEANFELLN